MDSNWDYPPADGLYDPTYEKAACGVGFIVNIDGKASSKIVRDAELLASRMKHRGACSCDNDTGDGAGMLCAIPHMLYSAALKEMDIELPPLGQYATGIFFLDQKTSTESEQKFTELAESHNFKVLAWRTVPTDRSSLGQVARGSEPYMRQVFLIPENIDPEKLNKKIWVLRKKATHQIPKPGRRFYICSLSHKTIVYKGQLSSDQLWTYFLDFADPLFETYLALVHTRFSTNTFPTWERAHPLRLMAHNGEINTLRGNVNLMKAREGVMKSSEFGEELQSLYPVVEPNLSDSGAVDCCLEFLVMAGNRGLPEAIMTMVPEAWQNDSTMHPEKKDFYRWAACAMEPWDGPALLTFTDGRYIGAILDRNGLRPSRYLITKDRHFVMASEVGVYDTDDSNILQKGRLKPGRMLLVDTTEKLVIKDEEMKLQIARSRPHTKWIQEQFSLGELYADESGPDPLPTDITPLDAESPPIRMNGLNGVNGTNGMNDIERSIVHDRRLAMFGYTIETLNMLLLPMVRTKKEALGSMGNDAPLACISTFQPLLYDYFKQLFAQVTNPPIDPFRERIVMSLSCPIGPQANILEPCAKQCHRLYLKNPIISLKDIEVIRRTSHRDWKTKTIDISYEYKGPGSLLRALDRICKDAKQAAKENYQIIILSDRKAGPGRIPVSILLALGACHHYLIEERQRMKIGLIAETGEAREVHHMCVLLGYGADAICPYLVFETMSKLKQEGVVEESLSDADVFKNYQDAMERGISKVMAKMGISTLQSYKGAQIFEAVGISKEIVDRCFKGTASRIGGVTFDVIAAEIYERHQIAYSEKECDSLVLRNPGFYHWRSGGESHVNDPQSIADLQAATKANDKNQYGKYVENAKRSIQACTLRGQLELVKSQNPVDLDEVEPASEIVKRFATGAMSFGSISLESHTTLAIAMNRVGGKSNTGEGGEDADRYLNQEPQNNKRSAIKQVASGRFGVTISYLANSDDLQIKMAQGAKPGEGGELPGYKVTPGIAKTRHSVPGVGLISPPPHHDIYSIEDLAELIYDLKASNPNARISVKLVSEVGVGVVAAGVAKGKSEHIVISGHDGGTGASSWTGIKNAGLPWELGVAETHQTLVLNNLRSRIVLQADGQIRCGFDVLIAAILGADEFGFSTAPLIVMGCTMMRKCHLNTCPVGIATQDPVLRKKFEGKPEYVVNFLFLLAEEVRRYMASLGIRKFQDLVGRTDLLKVREDVPDKVKLLDFTNILKNALQMRPDVNTVGGSVPQDFELEKRLDEKIIAKASDVLDKKSNYVLIESKIQNECRTFGATLSYHIAKIFGDDGLPERTINIHLKGHGGQSFCAFLAKGVYVRLEGDSNDYVGKGLSGGEVVIFPPKGLPEDFQTDKNVIVGNVCLYGATSGTAFFRGMAAERFCVRNSGAVAVVEGVGDHGCEYMTGGRVVILGPTGRNFAAGMSGGIAYVLDTDGSFRAKCNMQMVELLDLSDPEEQKEVKGLLERFFEETGSVIAEDLLSDWPAKCPMFIKVFPYEYQRALKELKAANNGVTADLKEDNENGTYNEDKTDGNGDNNSGVKDIEDTVPDKQIEKLKMEKLDKIRGFVKYKRATEMYRPAEIRKNDWNEIYNHRGVRKGLKMQAARCMECGVPFCQSSHGCPLGNIIPKWNDLIFHDNWEEALFQLLQTNNFPEFTGRVCPAPCEGACVLGINEPAVTIKNIECAIIDNAFEKGWMKPQIPAFRTGKKVAVIGSGPSGLAAAHQLNKAGHTVKVFERNDRIGGLLQYGIPTMKLEKNVIQRRVKLMEEEGIIFKTNVDVGKDISIRELSEDYDSVVLCMGATWPRDLPIAGRSLDSIHFAMSFLETWQKKQMGNDINISKLNAKDKDVIVIGGGDTGCDCIATSLRQGAKSITTFEILPEPPPSRAKDNPWPTFPRVFKVDYGHEEVKVKFGRDPRRYSTLSKEFIDNGNGSVGGIKTVQVAWKKDENGRWQMNEIEGTEKVYKADIILLAMGFLGPEKYIIEELSIEEDPRSNIKTNGGYSTSVDKFFAAGDCRRGQSLVVWAIAEGRQAAKEVDAYLMGNSVLPGPGGIIQYKKNG